MPYPRKVWQTFLSGLDKIQGRAEVRSRPLRIHFEINDFCNLKCIMCSRENPNIPKDSGAIPLETVKELAPYLKSASYVGIAGNGEPFMHVEMLDILDFICTQGAVPSTITNCTLLRQEVCDRLVELGPSLLMASIDGGTKEVFESIRKGANFDLIRENLLRLRATKERAGTPYPVVNFITCLMKQNLYDLENVVRFAHEVAAAEINVQNLFPYHDGAWPHVVTDFELLDERITEARKLGDELGVRVRYSPMGFSVEERIAHAERVGDETAPSAGLQLNGRPWEIKTVGDDLRDILEKKRRNEPLGPKALEMSAGGCSVTVEKAPESAAALEEDGTSNAENGSVPSSDDINGTDSEELSAETHQLAEPEMPEANTAEGEPKYYCQNVFQQLHITTGGEVRPCCFWTGKTLGRLEERGIDEMWNDPYMVSVRQAILDGKIPKDCKTCHNLVPYDRSAIWADTHHEVVQALKR